MSSTRNVGPVDGPDVRSLSGVGTIESPDLNSDLRRVADSPIFHTLVQERTRFGWILTILMLIVYYGFIGLIAFDKPLLATKVVGVTTLGLFLGSGVIVFAFVLTGIYVARANTRFDQLSAELARSVSR